MGFNPTDMGTKPEALAIEAAELPLARIIREQGRLKGWLAEKLGCGPERLSRILSGDRSMTLEEAAKASAALGVPIEALLPVRAETFEGGGS